MAWLREEHHNRPAIERTRFLFEFCAGTGLRISELLALRWIDLTLDAGKPLVLDAAGRFQGYRGVARDISAERLSMLEAQKLARFDGLTGLPNRHHFLHEAARAAGRLTLGGHEDAGVLLPELVLVQAVEDGLLLDEEDELGLGGDELEVLLLADAGDAPAAAAHARMESGEHIGKIVLEM